MSDTALKTALKKISGYVARLETENNQLRSELEQVKKLNLQLSQKVFYDAHREACSWGSGSEQAFNHANRVLDSVIAVDKGES